MSRLPAKKLVVRVRRDYDGKVYSELADAALDGVTNAVEVRDGKRVRFVVVDRQKGRSPSPETVTFRAERIASLLGLSYDEDLTWPCARIERGDNECRCPRCVKHDNNFGRKDA